MNQIIRSLILLQFALCLPSLLAECRLSEVKLRILKVSLFLMMTTFVLCDSCVLEVLGVGLVLLNFCMLYGRKLNANHKFYLLTLVFTLIIFCGRIAWCGFSEFVVREESCLDHSQFIPNSKSNVNIARCNPVHDKRANIACKLLFGKDADEAATRKVNENSTSVDFDVASSNGTHYTVCVKKDCNKVYVKKMTVDTVTNNACLP